MQYLLCTRQSAVCCILCSLESILPPVVPIILQHYDLPVAGEHFPLMEHWRGLAASWGRGSLGLKAPYLI